MLKVAICDNEAQELERAAALLRTFFAQKPDRASLTLFESGEDLLAALERGEDFDLYLLDVLMPGMNGIEVGKAIRRRGLDGMIIYLTASPDYAVDSYLTQAFFYLLKPVGEQALFEVLERAAQALQKRRNGAVIVSTAAGLRSIPLNDILYVERVDRAMRYHLTGGETVDSRTIRGTFRQSVAALLEDGRFALCGASFVLGIHHVKSMEKGEVLLDSGDSVPVPRLVFPDVKRAWMNYWLGGVKL